MSVNVYRSEEDRGLCPLCCPGAAAVNSADGHWDKMYELKHSSEADSLIQFNSRSLSCHITIFISQSLPVKQGNR